jgi:hypothetical protein
VGDEKSLIMLTFLVFSNINQCTNIFLQSK